MRWVYLFLLFVIHETSLHAISLGVDRLFSEKMKDLHGKNIALVINHTSVNSEHQSTLSLFRDAKIPPVAIFTPEHGLKGSSYAFEFIAHGKEGKVPVYSLHGETRRPKEEMLQGIDLIVYDIQCTGVRAYTYPTTLFYIMEEAAKKKIPVIVLDRPNPINGLIVDGPMLEEKWRSFIGYLNVPYCHGMTIGELAHFFNEEYQVGCKLDVVKMIGWKREMSFRDTGLFWIPPSPNVPEPDTPIYSSSTGLLGELSLASIGIGFTLPFKIVGAPWIQAEEFAAKLNAQKLPGVYFQPFHFRPFCGLYQGVECGGVLIHIRDMQAYRPLAVQYLLIGMIKSLYPDEFRKRVQDSKKAQELFCKANGTEEIYEILLKEKYPAWKLIEFHKKERALFLEKRKKYLMY